MTGHYDSQYWWPYLLKFLQFIIWFTNCWYNICISGDLQSGPVLLRHSLNKCIYEFEWHTAAACVLAEKLGTNCKVYDDDLGMAVQNVVR